MELLWHFSGSSIILICEIYNSLGFSLFCVFAPSIVQSLTTQVKEFYDVLLINVSLLFTVAYSLA